MQRIIICILSSLLCAGTLVAQAPEKGQKTEKKSCVFKHGILKSKRQKAKEDAANAPEPSKDEKKYTDLTDKATLSEGLFRTILKENKLYFELPDSILGKDLLLANRVSRTSDNSLFVAGQMVTAPFMFRFTKSGKKIYMHRVQSTTIIDDDDPITPSFERNYSDPIMLAFDIYTNHDGNSVIDVSSMFLGQEGAISPVNPRSQLSPMGGVAEYLSVSAFPKNVEIRSLLGYKGANQRTVTIEVHRSIVLLPEQPMAMRPQDNRVGYFSSERQHFSTNRDNIDEYEIIHRWRLEPKDSVAYARGEVVEPIKPITFYIDTVFPKKWRDAIVAGVLDWNKAFEAAGFKDAVVAKLYPTPQEDPEFNPDDMRYSCVKYATTTIANAMGPSYVDPRSGEILNADVIWYHNVSSLLHHWRFTQTAAVDERVRVKTFPDELMAESMRYVASHEVGHTLGLMHNMGASYAFPVDSLRSPSFTQKYGTTPSIMDYARNNFVAQPGDLERGVKLTPPLIGVYDIYAINWGYRIIPGNKSMKETKEILNQWIEEKIDDPMYTFGAQQMNTMDPTDQTEDLGNDHIKAGNYAISNLKIIAKNYETWLYEPGQTTAFLEETHGEIMSQFMRHLRHVVPYVGGRIYYENRQGDGMMPLSYVSKADQKRALSWVVAQLRDIPNWLLTPAVTQMYDASASNETTLKRRNIVPSVLSSLFSGFRLQGIIDGSEATKGTGYTLEAYLDDACKEIFAKSLAGQKLSENDMAIENTMMSILLSNASNKSQTDGPSVRRALYEETVEDLLPCFHRSSTKVGKPDDANFFRYNMLAPGPQNFRVKPAMYAKLLEMRSLYQRRATSSGDLASRNFYKHWIMTINNELEGK